MTDSPTSQAMHLAMTELKERAERVAELEEALRWAIRKIDQDTCLHEETYRGGAIWTICRACDSKWADDRGGFTPYEEPKELTAARDLLNAADVPTIKHEDVAAYIVLCEDGVVATIHTAPAAYKLKAGRYPLVLVADTKENDRA